MAAASSRLHGGEGGGQSLSWVKEAHEVGSAKSARSGPPAILLLASSCVRVAALVGGGPQEAAEGAVCLGAAGAATDRAARRAPVLAVVVTQSVGAIDAVEVEVPRELYRLAGPRSTSFSPAVTGLGPTLAPQ